MSGSFLSYDDDGRISGIKLPTWVGSVIRAFLNALTPSWSFVCSVGGMLGRAVQRIWVGVVLGLLTGCILKIVASSVILAAPLAGCDGLTLIWTLLHHPYVPQVACHPLPTTFMNVYKCLDEVEVVLSELSAARTQHPDLNASDANVWTDPVAFVPGYTSEQEHLASWQDGIQSRIDTLVAELEKTRESLLLSGAVHGPELDKPDFALFTTGGVTLENLTSPTRERPALPLTSRSKGSDMAIHYDVNPGYCWPFSGPRGHLAVKLSQPVVIEEVAIDHTRSHWDHSHAPRDMELWALVEGAEALEKTALWAAQSDHTPPDDLRTLFGNDRYLRIAHFEYDIRSPDVTQAFPIDKGFRELELPLRVILLLVADNWGDDEYTCIYRFRVHGHLPLDVRNVV